MSLILFIDTAQQDAGIYLGKNGELIGAELSANPLDHASWIHIAIGQLLLRHQKSLRDLSAVAVIEGPGSYTGLRVGMATAKGLCYGLNIPLITENSLKAMAASFLYNETALTANFSANNTANNYLLAPMIDARRQEVFTALYDKNLETALVPQSMILDGFSFAEILKEKIIFFFGSGSSKWNDICNHPNANFVSTSTSGEALVLLCNEKFLNKEFAILTYCEPVYLKEFYIHHK